MADINLNELTLENVGSWPPVVKVISGIVILIVIVGLGYLLSFKSQLEQLDRLERKEKELLQVVETKQQLAANLHLYRKQLAQMQSKFGKLLKQLPGKSEIPELLEEISQIGIKSGLKFQLFDPQAEVRHDFYVEVPIKIIVDGDFHQIAEFISRVANMKRIVTMHNFELRFPDPKKTEGKKPIRLINGRLPLFMTLTAKVYRYRSFD